MTLSRSNRGTRPVETLLDCIGNTPLVPIRRIPSRRGARILAKVESVNPGGSIKDRIALSMVEGAERRGELTKDRIILEASSGNTGIGLAMVAAVKGYRCLIAMSEGASIERRQIMQAYGAEILLTPASKGTDGAIEAVYRMALEYPDRYYCTDQFNNPDNWKAHYYGTAEEIWEQAGRSLRSIVVALGTTGTAMGIARRMRELDPRVRIVAVEPYFGHRIQGLKNMKESYRPGIFDKRLLDAIVNVGDDEAFEMTRRLAREEGIFVGMSSGAAMVAALDEAARLDEGDVVVIFPDSGERYLSTGVFAVPGKRSACDGPRLTNTLTRTRECFRPLVPGRAGIYSCGPTADEYAHLGLARRVVFADLVRRLLEANHIEVVHVMNITDVDDRTVHAAISSGEDLRTLTGRYAQAFLEDMDQLCIRPAEHLPRASDHVDEMIRITERLIEKGLAYVTHGSVYFDISKLPSYGRLSRLDLASIDVGRTVDLDDYDKDSPVDFTLFKRVSLEELKRGIGFDSPWGKVRPGWHIECVAMSMKYLGEFFDIHTSGTDLIFPHHENEIAMATALTGRPLAQMWIHCSPVLVGGKKMSTGAGNAVTVRELLARGYTGRQIRFFLERTNYRKPVHYSPELLDSACTSLSRIDETIHRIMERAGDGEEASPDMDRTCREAMTGFHASLNEDLNVAGALASLYGLLRTVTHKLERGTLTPGDAQAVISSLAEVDKILGCLSLETRQPSLPDDVKALVEEREKARQDRDWAKADKIRAQISALGYTVEDTRHGAPRIRRTG
ncbi:MAG: cysteine--tRNA ligase [Deltaproteobacteria bacterium]